MGSLSLLVAVGCTRTSGSIKPEFPEGEGQRSNIADRDGGIRDTDLGPDIESAGSLRGIDLAKARDLTAIYFAYNSANLQAEAVADLERHIAYLRKNPTPRVQIEGHCDERGTYEYNLALGERRAQAIRKFLARRGVAADRLYTISYGEERPAKRGHDESAWRKNRRAEVRDAR